MWINRKELLFLHSENGSVVQLNRIPDYGFGG